MENCEQTPPGQEPLLATPTSPEVTTWRLGEGTELASSSTYQTAEARQPDSRAQGLAQTRAPAGGTPQGRTQLLLPPPPSYCSTGPWGARPPHPPPPLNKQTPHPPHLQFLPPLPAGQGAAVAPLAGWADLPTTPLRTPAPPTTPSTTRARRVQGKGLGKKSFAC